jgi:2-dehydro-3-deoxygluconokinase
MSAGLELVTFGEAMALFLASDGRPLAAATRFDRQVAGAELNVAVGLARLGHRVGWFGRLGRDSAGAAVRAVLRAEGVDDSRVVDDRQRPTGLLVRDRHGERRVRVDYHRAASAASALHEGDVDGTYVTGARMLHATGVTPALSPSARRATFAALQSAREAGVTTVVDPNLRLKLWGARTARPVLRRLVALADVVLANAEEAALITGAEDREQAAQRLLSMGARMVVIKAGADGAWATDGEVAVAAPPRPVTVIDPVGAGDAFDAGFLSGLLRGAALERCLELGAIVGAACVQAPGDLDGLPTAAEVEALLGALVEVDR